MVNSFLKKDEALKNRNKNQSVNSKAEQMAQRANLLVEKVKQGELSKVEKYIEESLANIESRKNQETQGQSTSISIQKEIDKKYSTFSLEKSKKRNKIINSGISTEEFLNLNIQMDRFHGNNTSVTISIDIYEKIRQYSDIKNLTMNFFVNKLIRVGLEQIDELSIEDIQRNMCYNANTRALPFCIDEKMESEFNLCIEKLKIKGYKFSRNTIICALINITLYKFHN